MAQEEAKKKAAEEAAAAEKKAKDKAPHSALPTPTVHLILLVHC